MASTMMSCTGRIPRVMTMTKTSMALLAAMLIVQWLMLCSWLAGISRRGMSNGL
ncbi:conserved hypothetical protein [Histoplasma capsulatum H143]|uniref:Uncharacterized protein n=1 Tax=Ajellomyces capsulatus (strain H143) TaxID=544712 RepID=C6H8R6_AJECH|nr:conserved hypothetical protein [Histoplasma capsulatum H143]